MLCENSTGRDELTPIQHHPYIGEHIRRRPPLESWRAKLSAGNTDGAWDEFITRYRRLILATIRRTLGDDDDVVDVFAEVCANLSANGLTRLLRHDESAGARFSTWLVAVVHHQTIDWVRQREGRHRVRPPAGLSRLQQQIFQHVFDERRTHVEAYELIRQGAPSDMTNWPKETIPTSLVPRSAIGWRAATFVASTSSSRRPQRPIDVTSPKSSSRPRISGTYCIRLDWRRSSTRRACNRVR